MLVDATHPEETRVVVVRGNRVEEFDFESANRKQLRGNIYLAKVTRVEPSLQAAFVDYGGNRHGFLAFSEIHPDYYQIPMADRQALLEEEHGHDDDEIHEEEKPAKKSRRRRSNRRSEARSVNTQEAEASKEETANEASPVEVETAVDAQTPEASGVSVEAEVSENEAAPVEASEASVVSTSEATEEGAPQTELSEESAQNEEPQAASDEDSTEEDDKTPPAQAHAVSDDDHLSADPEDLEENEDDEEEEDEELSASSDDDEDEDDDDDDDEDSGVEHVGAEDALEEVPERRSRRRTKQYKIQEVIKRRQILLVQVVKEERGNKGAALTTYLSLAGRYSVLMPNTARGGGISRKITNVSDRKRLKQIASELEVADGMGVILRTAGASRTKTEIKRDFEYLLRLWENVRDLTLKSAAPMLVYEEGSLIKRSIRDLYNKDIDQVLVSGEEGYKEAKTFMRMLMPSHARNVQPYREPQPIFTRMGIESQLDAMFSPQVTLKSGGYIVIDQTEALVSIDVNSGRSTREHNIEDTALSTNLEAAEEISRQLRLRDLAGLVVIDFIDMEEKRNNRAVEKRLKDCLKSDRARIQVGRISHFGLMEMSRQRIRTGVLESSMDPCPHCQGTGYVRAASSVALLVLRSIEDHLLKGVTHHVIVKTRGNVALYILNQKRENLFELENRFGVHIHVEVDDHLEGKHLEIDRGEPLAEPVAPTPTISMKTFEDIDNDFAFEAFEQDEEEKEREEESSSKRRRRRRRRKKSQTEARTPRDENDEAESAEGEDGDVTDSSTEQSAESRDDENGSEDKPKKSRRRGRRGGRRNRRNRGSDADAQEMTAEAMEVAGENPEDYRLTGEFSPAASDANDDEAQPDVLFYEGAPLASEGIEVAAIELAENETASPVNTDDVQSEPEDVKPASEEMTEASAAVDDSALDAEPASDPIVPSTSEGEGNADEASQEVAVSENVAAEEAPAPEAASEEVTAEETSSDEPQEQAAMSAPVAEPEEVSEPVAQPETEAVVKEEKPEDNRPKRTGWWNRSGFL